MVKENSEKKWLVLLVILVAITLVVDLLSLNVLYKVTNNLSLSGELAVQPPKQPSPQQVCMSGCSVCESDCREYNMSDNCGTYCGGYYDYNHNSGRVRYVSCSDKCKGI